MWSLTVLILALVLSLSGAAQTPQPALRVVVIAGEDAVNIIQQKTAVRPIVEVRDRNNLPVPGALVTFSIEGGKAASFGGASSLTVATNAAGQAAVTSLTPSVSGAFQIQVSAAFQGQVATATIAQTNVLTAAQAAAAAGANSAGGAGGAGGSGGGSAGGAAGGAAGGGGLSATTIAVAGAAVAGGAVAATQVLNKEKDAGDDSFTGSFSGTIVSTLVSRNTGLTCTITRTVNGTATLKLTANTASAVSGELELTGTDVVVAQSCNGPGQSSNFSGRIAVSGPPSSLRGSETRSDTQPGATGETIQATRTFLFEGTLSGNTVTGTLKHEGRSVATGGGGGPVDETSVGNFPLSMTKS